MIYASLKANCFLLVGVEICSIKRQGTQWVEKNSEGACLFLSMYIPPMFSKDFTPFENAQRWMGKNTFPILLFNDDKMIGEH